MTMGAEATAKQMEVLAALDAIALDKKYNRLKYWKPYPKQKVFFKEGATRRERLLMAPNRVGKTECGAAEMAYHLTGLYPKDWEGYRFDSAVSAWAVGESGTKTRDTIQEKLCGKPGLESMMGSGFIPRDAIKDRPSQSRSATDAIDTIHIIHKTKGIEDGISTLTFKTYEQGRTKFEGTTMDLIWLDEEPPQDVFQECVTRITASTERPKGGIMFTTFTPLKGAGEVVKRYLYGDNPARALCRISIEDATHISPEERLFRFNSMPPHERRASYYGEPALGEGAVFPVDQTTLLEDPIPLDQVPANWVKIWGIDFGIGHPFAAALIAWDRDYDIIHVLHCFKVKDQLPISHAYTMNEIAANVPVAWPHDGAAREASTGDQLIKAYKLHLPNVLGEHATHPDGGYSTEAGIMEMITRMTTERFKVSRMCSEWFKEFNSYYRKDGLIVKDDDDIMSATRIAVMMRRKARALPLGNRKNRVITNRMLNSDQAIKQRVDGYDIFDPSKSTVSEVGRNGLPEFSVKMFQ